MEKIMKLKKEHFEPFDPTFEITEQPEIQLLHMMAATNGNGKGNSNSSQIPVEHDAAAQWDCKF